MQTHDYDDNDEFLITQQEWSINSEEPGSQTQMK